MAGEDSRPSGQRFPHNYVPGYLGGVAPFESHMNNVSLQTGEEFSVDFLLDRLAPIAARGPPERPGIERVHMKRGGFNFHQNIHPGYEDLPGVLGLRRTESDSASDADSPCRMQMDTDQKVSHDPSDEASPSPASVLLQESVSHPHSTGTSTFSKPGGFKFLCSFGGKILPRPGDGKLRYVGGETRIISISPNLSWQELTQKTLRICNRYHTIKYQLPGEDLDALISVSSDEDLHHMVEEYYGFHKADRSQRLRLFLIPAEESENNSIDMTSLQNSSEYHYVVAVNCISPKEIPSRNRPNKLGQNVDSSPVLFDDSFAFICPSDDVGRSEVSSPVGVFSRRPPQLFLPLRNAAGAAALSPTLFTGPVQQRNSKNPWKHPGEDQVVIDQGLQRSYQFDIGHGPCGMPNYKKAYLPSDDQISAQKHGTHFQYQRVSPPLSPNDYSQSGFSYCKKSALEEKASAPGMFSGQHADPPGMISGWNHPVGRHGIPHALCDPMLEDHVGKNFSCLKDTISPADCTVSQLPRQLCQDKLEERTALENKGIFDFEFSMLQNLMPTSSEPDCSDSLDLFGLPRRNIARYRKGYRFDEKHQDEGIVMDHDSKSESCCGQHDLDSSLLMSDTKGALNDNIDRARGTTTNTSELDCSNHHLTSIQGADVPSQELKALESSVPASSYNASEILLDVLEEKSILNQAGNTKPLIPVSSYNLGKYEPSCSSEQLKDATDCKPPASWLNSLSEIVYTIEFPELCMKEQYSDENSSDMISLSSSNLTSHLPPGYISQDSRDPQERVDSPTNSASSELLNVQFDNSDQSLNWHIDEPSNGPPFHNASTSETSTRQPHIFDQGPFNYGDPNGEDKDNVKHGDKPFRREDIRLRQDWNVKAATEVLVTIEDVTDNVPTDIPVSPTIEPRVMHHATMDMDVDNMSTPKVTVVDSSTPVSESEDVHADGRVTDESTGNAMKAEIEAGTYSLQMIKRADLEELRELGSGTFGTVYYGKWRGTDVAIKRIKKSCFAARTSEQENLQVIYVFLKCEGGILNNTLRPPIPAQCDPEWRKLMEQCWSPDPAARPSFAEITTRLRRMSMTPQAKGRHC
ncbi:hypothetical protein Taro_003627 [Colocasia esculenta]|uniref:Protein kinase domain-containing protein n=1 Tax=Colocasia esculenta TaxID=4460 RepID=A0A843TPD1_COLES|nr:hypothetical protein [Colocasia esculenta]